MRVQYDTPIQDVTPTLSNEGKGETVYFSILITNPCFHLPLLSTTTIITQTRSSNPSILPSRTAPQKRNRNHEYTKPLFPRNNARRNHHRRHRKLDQLSSNIARRASQQQYLQERNLRLQTENIDLQRRVKALREERITGCLGPMLWIWAVGYGVYSFVWGMHRMGHCHQSCFGI